MNTWINFRVISFHQLDVIYYRFSSNKVDFFFSCLWFFAPVLPLNLIKPGSTWFNQLTNKSEVTHWREYNEERSNF